MKKYEFKLDKRLQEIIAKPIRTFFDVALILLHSLMYISWQKPCETVEGNFKIVINKMNRMFFMQDNKIFSFTIPFSLRENEDGGLEIYDSSSLVDNKCLVVLIEILTTVKNNPSELIDYMSFLDEHDLSESEIIVVKSTMNTIILNEYGYLRYDEDEERESGEMHPKYHMDINYSNAGTYKLGLEEKIRYQWFQDCLDITKPCKFIKTSNN